MLPEFIITDYETGVTSAISQVFSYSTHLGCWFHYTQCIYRKTQEMGLTTLYKSDPNFQKIARKLYSLPFLPETEVISAFMDYQNAIKNHLDRNRNLQKTFDSVWNFWLFGSLKLEMWNVFDRPVTMRTTNKCENWNSSWNKEVGSSNPNFWNTIKKLGKKERESNLELLGESSKGNHHLCRRKFMCSSMKKCFA